MTSNNKNLISNIYIKMVKSSGGG